MVFLHLFAPWSVCFFVLDGMEPAVARRPLPKHPRLSSMEPAVASSRLSSMEPAVAISSLSKRKRSSRSTSSTALCTTAASSFAYPIAPFVPAEEPRAFNPCVRSRLATRLIRDNLWCGKAASKVQQYAEDALQDGTPPHPDLVALAKLGSSGLFPGNCWKELQKRFMRKTVSKHLHRTRLPVAAGQGRKKTQCIHTLYPHMLFSCLYHNHRHAFQDRVLGGDSGNVQRFWDSQIHHPDYGHVAKLDPEVRAKLVPLAIHGDDVPAIGVGKAWTKMVQCLSWSSVLARGPTNVINFIISLMYLCLAVLRGVTDTWEEFWRHLIWSCNALEDGRWPVLDAYGRALTTALEIRRAGQWLADGFRGILWVIRADLDFLFHRYKLANSACLAGPCVLCSCNSSDKPWTDYRRDLAKGLKSFWT